MIVVDTNVIHYCWVRGPNTEIAQAVRKKDPDWHAPVLWRSEMRNVLTAYLRRGLLSRTQVAHILDVAAQALEQGEHLIADDRVLDVVTKSELTAYDAEFVALASALSVPLVTADKTVLRAFPGLALTMDAFFET
ncbi:hypothetical protein BH20PSE1_BH20PSE1_18740 [soil metagenome]